jgi:branched-subunit amino acid ABC-type transport system permease component
VTGGIGEVAGAVGAGIAVGAALPPTPVDIRSISEAGIFRSSPVTSCTVT